MSKFSITTAIAYPNAAPHIGFAMEILQADALARYHRMVGDDVYFLTGTDEHGMKMVQAARDAGMKTQDFVDKNAAMFRELTKFFNISNTEFIRTSSAFHGSGAQKLWKRIADAGDFYPNAYSGLYCVACEAYVTEKDLVDGNCPTHKKPPEHYEEKNYFFRYTKYIPEIKKLIEDGTLKILPESRKNEMLNLLEEARDISFSRPASALTWGIPVPDDPSQTMYVWCDALSNYITALDYEHDGELFKKFWPADIHLIGKDILRFHAGYWIAMLLSAKLPLPKAIYVHGYVTSEGQKMSKSLGNVVDPFAMGKEYGVEPVRYYLLREIPTTDDGDFSRSRFEAMYESELANNLGNLVSRVLTMAEKYSGGKVPAVSKEEAIVSKVHGAWTEYQGHVDRFNIKGAIETMISLLVFSNQYIDEKKPWELAKKDPGEVLHILYHLLEILRHISFMLLPLLPHAAQRIRAALHVESEKLYPDQIAWGMLKEGATVKKIPSLFPKK